MRSAVTIASAVLGGSFLAVAGDARAGAAWGDATLERADVRVELDDAGRAEITHTIGLHVSGKKFRAFVLEGIEDGLEAPQDEATLAGRDGPGWPATATDAKGTVLPAFVEPAKEPHKLRVRLGIDGLPRGEWTVSLRYRVDLAKAGAFVRDGALTKLTWSAPQWPEGYDGGKIIIALPAAPTEPKLAIADVAGDGEHSSEGLALVALRRGSLRDEVEITRPHVSPHDDARWILRVDPKALLNVPASAAALEHRDATVAATPTGKSARRAFALLLAAAFGATALALSRRDRDAERAAAFRPLLPLGRAARTLGFGAASTLAIAATWTSYPLVGAALVVLAMAIATLRAPFPENERRAAGRWLAIPDAAIGAPTRAVLGPFDPAGTFGRVIGVSLALAAGVAIFVLGRRDPRAALGVAVNAALLLPLFASGRAGQLPPDRVVDAWSLLSPIAEALRATEGGRVKAIARMAGKKVDEVRLRIDPVAGSPLRSIEVGCGIVHGSGGSRLVPELLVRCADDDALSLVSGAMHPEDELGTAFGRMEGERVLCVRPSDSSPAAVVARVRATLEALGARTSQPAPEAAPESKKAASRAAA